MVVTPLGLAPEPFSQIEEAKGIGKEEEKFYNIDT
jgi:hypothetical protein